MNAWFDVLDLKRDSRYDEDGVKESSQNRELSISTNNYIQSICNLSPFFFEVLSLIQEEIKSGIPSDRIMIGGFSQGGATALYTTLTGSIRFAGVLALSTFLVRALTY